jgi:hypothetical protein
MGEWLPDDGRRVEGIQLDERGVGQESLGIGVRHEIVERQWDPFSFRSRQARSPDLVHDRSVSWARLEQLVPAGAPVGVHDGLAGDVNGLARIERDSHTSRL